jgi:putative restriction endonuclease
MDWAERFTKLRPWARGDERAAHKPLLLLYALGQFQRNGDAPILYSQAEEQLGRLLKEFGPPRPTSPAYPFHHLTSDRLWTVTSASGEGSPGASPTALRSRQAAGRRTPDLAWALQRDPLLLAQLAHVLLDNNFEPSLHEDICVAVGIDLEEAETPGPAKAGAGAVTRSSLAAS